MSLVSKSLNLVLFIGYSNWKQKVNAHPKSDFDSLKKWLSKANTNYKGWVSSVKET